MADRLLEDVRVVLFDYGNTLAHLDHAFIAATLADHGHVTSPGDVGAADHAAKRWVDRLFADRRAGRDGDRVPSYFGMILETLGVAGDRTPAVLSVLDAAHADECLWRVVAADTADVLGQMQARGFRLGVISNADGRVPGDLARHGLERHFDTVIDSHLVGVEKPDPRIFSLALARLGAAPDDAVYVGDVYSIDVEGARAAGLIPVLMDPLDLYDADCIRIRSLGELLAMLPAAPGPAAGAR